MNKDYAFPDNLNKEVIKKFRKDNSLSRKQLAEVLNISVRTIEKWENSETKITGPVVFLLTILQEKPELLEKYRLPKKKYPLRFFYMSTNGINTVIDVDMLNRKVSFRNYTDRLILRAFGNKEEVTYEEFETFLESRVFPHERDKMKIELEILGLRNYDLLSIIRKTEGRTEEDDCYLLIDKEQS